MNKIILYLKFLFRKRLKISTDFIKVRITDFEFNQTQEDIKNFNKAVANSENDKLKTTQHPLYYTKVSWRIIENLNDLLEQKINDDILKSIVHLSEYFVFHYKADANSNIIVKTKIYSISKHKKGTRMTLKLNYYADNKLIAEEYTTGLMFGVKCLGEERCLEKIPKSIKIETQPIWQKTIDIDSNLPYFYAEKTEIDAPIHTNPKFAKSIGLPDIILQGTCTFSKAISLIIEKEFEENNIIIESVSAKFTGMVMPPDSILVRLLKKEDKSVYFDVLNNKNQAVIRGGEIKVK